MELTDKERKAISDLVKLAWQAGAIRSPEDAMVLEKLKEKVEKDK